MASKTATTTHQRVARVGPRRQIVIPREIFKGLRMRAGDFVAFVQTDDGVLLKPKHALDPDDILTPEESALVKKAEREMRQGKYVTLDQLRHDLDRTRPRRSRKTA